MSVMRDRRRRRSVSRNRSISPSAASGWMQYASGAVEHLPAMVNYFPNPSFETDSNADGLADGCAKSAQATITGTPVNTLVAGRLGGLAQRIQYTGVAGDSAGNLAGDYETTSTEDGSFVPGEYAAFSVYIKGAVNGVTVGLRVAFYTAADAYISNMEKDITASLAAGFTRVSIVGLAPANARRARGRLTLRGIGTGDTIDITLDDMMLEKSAFVTPYFDGSYPACAWSDAAHASTSTRTGTTLVYPGGDYCVDDQGTIAFRFTSGWAANDGLAHPLFAVRKADDSGDAISVFKHVDNKIYVGLFGAGTLYAKTAALTWGAGTSHVVVVRWKNGDEDAPTLDLCVDGTAVAQSANNQTITVGSITPGSTANGSSASYVGPAIVSPMWHSDLWTTNISANDGAAFLDRDVLNNTYCSNGDLLMPFASDATAWQKVGDDSPFDYGVIVFDGNSLTGGIPDSTANSYPKQTMDALYPDGDSPWQWFNVWESSQSTTQMIADAATDVDALRMPGKRNVLFFWEGFVDYRDTPGITKELVYQNLVDYAAARRAAGWDDVFCLTLPPNGQIAEEPYETDRHWVSDQLVENSSSLGVHVIDVAGDEHFDSFADASNATYFDDGLHLTEAGYGVVAQLSAAVAGPVLL